LGLWKEKWLPKKPEKGKEAWEEKGCKDVKGWDAKGRGKVVCLEQLSDPE